MAAVLRVGRLARPSHLRPDRLAACAALQQPQRRDLHSMIPAAAEVAKPLVGASLTQFLQVSPPLAAQVLFVSPMQAMGQFRANGTTGSVSALPYAAMAANGVAWTTYGILGSDLTIALANIPPAILGTYYCYTFYQHRAPEAITLPYFGAAALFSGGIGIAAMTLPLATAKMLIGYAGVSVCTIMFAGPLASIRTVLSERSAQSLPLAYTLAGVANCTLWTSYGALVIFDPFVWGPNSLGLVFSLAQLGLIVRFGSAPPAASSSPAADMSAAKMAGIDSAKEAAGQAVAAAQAGVKERGAVEAKPAQADEETKKRS